MNVYIYTTMLKGFYVYAWIIAKSQSIFSNEVGSSRDMSLMWECWFLYDLVHHVVWSMYFVFVGTSLRWD